MERLFADRFFDRVCNLAAQAGVRYSIVNPRAYVESNVVGRPFSTHESTNHPVSLYAATKKADELMAHAYSHLYGIPTTGLRFFTVYGPWGRPDMAYYKFAQAIAEGRPIDVYNGGDMLRDFTFIDDIVEGIVRVIDRPPEGDPLWDASKPDPASSSAPYRVYNIGNNCPVRLGDFIVALESAMGAKAEKRYLPMQSGDVYATEADVSDLERDFGWKPSTQVEEGLASFASWFKKYRAAER